MSDQHQEQINADRAAMRETMATIQRYIDETEPLGSWAHLVAKLRQWMGVEGTRSAPVEQPHYWTPDPTKRFCVVCGDNDLGSVWGIHRFQIQPGDPDFKAPSLPTSAGVPVTPSSAQEESCESDGADLSAGGGLATNSKSVTPIATPVGAAGIPGPNDAPTSAGPQMERTPHPGMDEVDPDYGLNAPTSAGVEQALTHIGHIINDAPYRLEERDGAWQAFLQNKADILAAVRAESIEKVICAAVKRDDGRVFYGHRHHHAMSAASDREYTRVRSDQQGFRTTHREFVDRHEAMQIHKATVGVSADRQGRYDGSDQLFSEDLY